MKTILSLLFALVASHQAPAQVIALGAGISAADNYFEHRVNGNTWSSRHLGIGPAMVVSLSGETRRWRDRISGSLVLTSYMNPVHTTDYGNAPYRSSYNITGAGINAHLYLLKAGPELYLGAGPRLDVVHGSGALFGGTASLGCNFPVGRSYLLGFRLSYYRQAGNLYESDNFDPDAPNYGLITADIDDYLIRNVQTADLQLVLSYRLGENR